MNWLSFTAIGSLFSNTFNLSPLVTTIVFIVFAIWSLSWKGVALWFAARNHQNRWFIVLLIINTLGLLEIIYLIGFRRDRKEGVTQSLFNNPLPDETDEEVDAEVAEATEA